MKKINFIPNFFPEILQRYCKFVWLLCLVALVTLAGQSHQKNSIKFLMFKSMQKSIHHSLLSCDIAKILHICYFEYFMRAWPHASIMIVSTYMFNIFNAFLLAINQLHSILPSWDNAKDVAKLLFRVRWPYLAMSTKSDSISLYKKFIPDLFLETLLKYCKHVILGDSGMPDLKKKSNLYLISFFIIRYY